MAPHFKRAVIHGVGLLGGSLGLAMRRRGIADRVVGLGRNPEKLDLALKCGAVDEITTDPREALRGADAVINCIPPRLIRETWSELAPHIAPGTFVTDVGSVKELLVEEAEKVFDESVLFIGSHPMAGSHDSGVEAARENLFDDATCFVTPTPRTPDRALALATEFWRAVGSNAVIIDPRRHDQLVASISHIPHLVAFNLVNLLFEHGDSTLYLQHVLGKGFLDTTRVAKSSPDVWEEIFTENAPSMLHNLDRLMQQLESWRGLLKDRDSAAIRDLLVKASHHRLELEIDTHE